MKKELVALVLLLLILAGNLWNQRRLDALSYALNKQVETAYAASQSGNWTAAEDAAMQAAETWAQAGPYTHIFIRHTDIDALTAAFCDYRGAFAGRDSGEICACYLRLTAAIQSLQNMERLSSGSIF